MQLHLIGTVVKISSDLPLKKKKRAFPIYNSTLKPSDDEKCGRHRREISLKQKKFIFHYFHISYFK